MNAIQPEHLINNWAYWGKAISSQPIVLSRLGSGLTNQSYLLNSNTGKLVLRINHPKSQSLGIDRERECLILKALDNLPGSEPKIAPQIIYSCPEYQYLVYRFIEGSAWQKADALKPGNQQRLKRIIERYQTINPAIKPRDYKNYLMHYWQQLEKKQQINNHLRDEWFRFLPRLSKTNWVSRLSHHDLIAENIIETDDGLRIIDWEYAHLGHPDLDWASVTGEKNTLASELLQWMNRLWTLLANAR